MTSQLFTTWGDFRTACDIIISQARRQLCIFDTDLSGIGLDQAARFAVLQNLAQTQTTPDIRIALRSTRHLHRDHPRLIKLLQTHGHVLRLQQIPDSLQHLRDTLILADGCHALVRFDLEQPRCKCILADPAASAPYQQRFEALWNEGGQPFSPTPLGL